MLKANPLIFYRLIALWVISEAFLGGIIHGLHIPVSGLIVGSAAVICISLIAYYVPRKGAILKATLIVCIFKMMLSPQAPFPAYIAVAFQGLLGEILFSLSRRWSIGNVQSAISNLQSPIANRQSPIGNLQSAICNLKYYKLACLLLAILSLTESALQRIIVLTIVYGMEGWRALDTFLTGLLGNETTGNYSLWLGLGYLGIHIATGFLVGFFAGGLPSRLHSKNTKIAYRPLPIGHSEEKEPARRNKFIKPSLLLIWLMLIGVYVQSYFHIGKPLLPASVPLKILVRSFIIVFAWYFVFAPVLKKILHRWLLKKRSALSFEIEQVLSILPATRKLLISNWQKVKSKGWRARIPSYCRMVLADVVSEPHRFQRVTGSNIYILSGPVQSGKTTSLMQWSEGRDDVYGILTPIVDGKRVFMNARTRETWPMEADDTNGRESTRMNANGSEEKVLKIGRYVFLQSGFDRAIQVIREHIRVICANSCHSWLIIDEVGPLELRGEGFGEVMAEMQNAKCKMIVVVREGLVVEVGKLFREDRFKIGENKTEAFLY